MNGLSYRLAALTCLTLALAIGTYGGWAYQIDALKPESLFYLGVGVLGILGFGIGFMVMNAFDKGGSLGPIWKQLPHSVSVSDAIRNHRVLQDNRRRSARNT